MQRERRETGESGSWRTANAALVNTIVVAKTSDNVVLDTENKLELVVAALLEHDGALLELFKVLLLVEALKDDVSIRSILEEHVHLNNHYAARVILGCKSHDTVREGHIEASKLGGANQTKNRNLTKTPRTKDRKSVSIHELALI